MEQKMIYAFRGWIAFVAFMDLGTAIRSYIEKRSFLVNTVENEYNDDEFTVSRILGIYSILKALVLVHCTLYIHYKPIVSIGICSLIITIMLYLTETIYFRTATLNFYVIFPCVLNSWLINQKNISVYTFLVFTLVGLIYFPLKLNLWNYIESSEESQFILKPPSMCRKRRSTRNNN